MLIALLTDTHAGVRNGSEVFADYQEDFYTNVFFPELKKRNIKTVFHGGDIFDRRTNTDHKMLYRAKKMFFDPLIENDIKMYLITGNHDVAHKNTNEVNTPRLFLESYKNITVIDNAPLTLDMGNQIHFIPWINNQNYKDIVKFIDECQSGLVIGHFELGGFEMHKGVVNEHGMDPSIFKKHKHVISGHFHTQSKSGNIQYIGNPFEFTWSDYNDSRGFWILETDTLEMEFVQNPYKMFYKFEYDDTKPEPVVTSDINRKYVNVTVVNNSDPYKFDLFMTKIYSESPFDVTVTDLSELTVSEMSDEEITNATKTTTDMIRSYVDSVENVEEDTKKEVEKLLTKIYGIAVGEDK